MDYLINDIDWQQIGSVIRATPAGVKRARSAGKIRGWQSCDFHAFGESISWASPPLTLTPGAADSTSGAGGRVSGRAGGRARANNKHQTYEWLKEVNIPISEGALTFPAFNESFDEDDRNDLAKAIELQRAGAKRTLSSADGRRLSALKAKLKVRVAKVEAADKKARAERANEQAADKQAAHKEINAKLAELGAPQLSEAVFLFGKAGEKLDEDDLEEVDEAIELQRAGAKRTLSSAEGRRLSALKAKLTVRVAKVEAAYKEAVAERNARKAAEGALHPGGLRPPIHCCGVKTKTVKKGRADQLWAYRCLGGCKREHERYPPAKAPGVSPPIDVSTLKRHKGKTAA